MSIFNLLGYKIIETKEDDNDINISLEPLNYQTNCKYCKSSNIRKKGSKKQFYFDIPIRNKRVRLIIKVQKYFCEDCKRTFQNNLPQISDTRNMTIRLLEHIQKQSLTKPFTHLANEIGMSEGNIRKIFKSYTDTLKAKYIFH